MEALCKDDSFSEISQEIPSSPNKNPNRLFFFLLEKLVRYFKTYLETQGAKNSQDDLEKE